MACSTQPFEGSFSQSVFNPSSYDIRFVKQIDKKNEKIKDLVLEIIRTQMPISSLFSPELKIDLSHFLNDQLLLHKIAIVLKLLLDQPNVDIHNIEEILHSHDLLKDITGSFKNDPTPYLQSLYTACLSALKLNSDKEDLSFSIQSRIFTLKNSLIAQVSPEAIRKKLKDSGLPIKTSNQIQFEGFNFIRESLKIHLMAIKNRETLPFNDQLNRNASQLLEFTRKITTTYLREHDQTCPDDPLTFRDPTGYNRHGHVAAVVLGTALEALGYQSQIMSRCDLEPKVNLAIAHTIIKILSPSQQCYLVDPSYLQFYKDVYLDWEQLPQNPVLVLEATEVDIYIEKNIMSEWRKNRDLLELRDLQTLRRLMLQDQNLCLGKPSLPQQISGPDLEQWVKNSYKRIWDIFSYRPLLVDGSFQDIFYGITPSRTYQLVQPLMIDQLISSLSLPEIERHLNHILKNSDRSKNNQSEILRLIARLPLLNRLKYRNLLDIDPRLEEIDPIANLYFCFLKKTVNPQEKNLHVIYGCSGTDCSSVLLATDAQDLTFIDLNETSVIKFEQALAQMRGPYQMGSNELRSLLEKSDRFLTYRARHLAVISHYKKTDGKTRQFIDNFELKLLFDLKELGVDLNRLSLTSIPHGVQLDFPWRYYNSAKIKRRCISIITADITNPSSYPKNLNQKIERHFDIFYMKGAFFAPRSYPQFLPYFAEHIRPGGWLMTTDKTWSMDTINPEECLQKNSFNMLKDSIKDFIENLLVPPLNVLAKNQILTLYPPARRVERNPGTDMTYWTLLNLRQKQTKKKDSR